ncbi:head-tail connector protein [Hansschlegelia quercus]|uniref:Phage gp6-like head-tail connector protein n=1 Tax=Hansschlegelia quercus TaxID=2528245 RepID=A0A4Q9GHN4_9HYPH|nr:head-tail connector protein [Hansschlegelia quercus]TBN48668.1 hypothetical protein EYR15_13860 [Hansschlegelia quercus]
MPAQILTAPAAEPISLGQAKAYLRLEHDAEDELVASLVAAAARQVEALTRRVLVAQRWRFSAAFPCGGGSIALKPRPVREVEAVRLQRADGGWTTLSPEQWRFDSGAERLTILAAAPAGRMVEADLAVGYGDPEDVPESLKLAIRRLTADFFERREARGETPADVASLVAPYRDLAL